MSKFFFIYLFRFLVKIRTLVNIVNYIVFTQRTREHIIQDFIHSKACVLLQAFQQYI